MAGYGGQLHAARACLHPYVDRQAPESTRVAGYDKRMAGNEFLDFVLDQLGGLDNVRAQRMFAGFGLYSAEAFFAIVYHDILYFKVNDDTRKDYTDAGMPPFKPYKGRPVTLQYYQVPAEVVEDADELCQWARRAIDGAVSVRKKKVTGARSRR